MHNNDILFCSNKTQHISVDPTTWSIWRFPPQVTQAVAVLSSITVKLTEDIKHGELEVSYTVMINIILH